MTIFEQADAQLLPGFTRRPVVVDGNEIMTLQAGNGPALLMLHGDPQTHLCWHEIAPKLLDRFRVVLADLRGRGESHKPPHNAQNNRYSKREMAREQVALMNQLGHERFSVVGHDRGARVARRLALDHPQTVEQLVLMDVVPALDFYNNTNARIAQDYFYFFFLTQDHPLPDSLIKADADAFMRSILLGLSDTPVKYSPIALKAYLAASTTDDAVTAMCECFRAGLHIDQQHDAIDMQRGNKIDCPTLIMWGENGIVGKHFNMEKLYTKWCSQPEFVSIQSGHFMPDEAPEATYKAIANFLK